MISFKITWIEMYAKKIWATLLRHQKIWAILFQWVQCGFEVVKCYSTVHIVNEEDKGFVFGLTREMKYARDLIWIG